VSALGGKFAVRHEEKWQDGKSEYEISARPLKLTMLCCALSIGGNNAVTAPMSQC
jgi:hypothetical protein